MKKIAFAVCSLFMTLSVSAQVPTAFNVTAPGWQEVALIVNNRMKAAKVYKTPSLQSPYFVYKPSARHEGQTAQDVGYWGTSTSRTVHFVSPSGARPVVAKKAGWVEIFKGGPKGADGWIQSNIAEISPKVDITAQNVAADPDLCELYGMVFFLEYDKAEQTATVNIGKLQDGLLIFPYQISGMPVSEAQDGKAAVGENDDYYFLELTKGEMEADGRPLISKFPSDVLARMLDIATLNDHPLVLMNSQKGLIRLNM